MDDFSLKNYEISNPIIAKKYLINGELKTWDGKMADVNSSISSTEDYKPTFIGRVPELEEAQAHMIL